MEQNSHTHSFARRRDQHKALGFGDSEHKRFDLELRSPCHRRVKVYSEHAGEFAVKRAASVSIRMTDAKDLRIFGTDFGRIHHLHVHAGFIDEVLQNFDNVYRVFALIPRSQGRRGVFGKPKVTTEVSLQIRGWLRTVHLTLAFVSIDGMPHSQRCIQAG